MNKPETIQDTLRRKAKEMRTQSVPLSDLIPLLRQAADDLDRLEKDEDGALIVSYTMGREDGKRMNGHVQPAEAVFAFAAWLTCRNEVTMLGANQDAAPAAALATRFIESQGWAAPRETYHTRLKPYPNE